MISEPSLSGLFGSHSKGPNRAGLKNPSMGPSTFMGQSINGWENKQWLD